MKIGDVVGGTNQQASKRVNYEGKVTGDFQFLFYIWLYFCLCMIKKNTYVVQVIIAQKAMNNRL